MGKDIGYRFFLFFSFSIFFLLEVKRQFFGRESFCGLVFHGGNFLWTGKFPEINLHGRICQNFYTKFILLTHC